MNKKVWCNFTKKIVYTGTLEECIKYLKGNNIYQSNYSKLTII